MEAGKFGLVYGLTYGFGTLYWLFGIFGISSMVLISIFAAYYGLLGWLIGLTRGQPPLPRAALIALFAVGIDWLRGDAWYLRFPWYTLPHALAQEPRWIALARWTGTYGLAFVVWFIAGSGAFVHRYAWAAFLLLPGASLLLPAFEPPDRRALLVQVEGPGLVEGLVPQAPAGPVDLAVMPEYAYSISPQKALLLDRGPAALAQRYSCPVVFGATSEREGGGYFNVAAVVDADGYLVGTFPKQRPVPLFNDGVPGDRRPVFPVAQGTLGIGVCYDFDAPEIAASLVSAGATILVCPTFDAMAWGRVQHVHHELLLRLRAVENDRWIVRTASSGRSEAVDPHGHASAEGVEIGETGLATVGYRHHDSVPLGGQAHILGPAAAIASVPIILYLLVQRWRRRPETPLERRD
jgi:apolipoprotein N-acyltransferase